MIKKLIFIFIFLLFFISYIKEFFACSIVGYVGDDDCKEYIVSGLDRLKYRGYDAAGFACLSNESSLLVFKSLGEFQNLRDRLDLINFPLGSIGIGHVRWGVHSANDENEAHPHTDCSKTIALVHHGLISNFMQLKESLKNKGHSFYSSSDSEVIAHLLEDNIKNEELVVAIQKTLNAIKGSLTCLAISSHYQDTMIAMRGADSPPLWISTDNTNVFFASHQTIFEKYSHHGFWMPQNSFVVASAGQAYLYDSNRQRSVIKIEQPISAMPYTNALTDFNLLKHDIILTTKFYGGFLDKAWQEVGCASMSALKNKNKEIFGSLYKQALARNAQLFFSTLSTLEPNFGPISQLFPLISPLFAYDFQCVLVQNNPNSNLGHLFTSLLISSSTLLSSLKDQ